MKKIKPPVIFFIAVILNHILDFRFPMLRVLSYPFTLIGLLPLIAGFIVMIKGVVFLEKSGTTHDVYKNPSKLITSGIYKYSRNPIYLSFLIMLIGTGMLFGSASSLLVVAAFFMLSNSYYIKYEEQILEFTFGEEYLEYKSRTPRWI